LKKLTSMFLILLILTGISIYAKTLSDEEQEEIISRMMYLRGEGPRPASLDSLGRAICGTDIAADFHFNRQYFTGKYAAEAEAMARPTLELYYYSPGGHFFIHYDTAGSHAVYQVDVDTIHGGPDGVPDYVNMVADICDSIWAFEVEHLGFPRPVSDGYAGGGDSSGLVDIYIAHIGSDYYGWTEPEFQINSLQYTSFIVIDNDYAGIPPYNQQSDLNGRLDAARVTLAHEFFHTIHYSMDWQEYENQGSLSPQARYWWEMSAVWMEEMMYDDINDYYTYLPFYYDDPYKGLQAVMSSIDLHQYGSAVFPLFLSERYDTVLIRDIWERCRDYGPGPNFPQAAHDAIDAYTGGAAGLRDAYQEFAVWNYFTGTRASQAPSGVGFSERAYYDAMIPDSFFMTFNDYDDNIFTWVEDRGWADSINGQLREFNGFPITFYESFLPQNLGTQYIRLRNINLLSDSTLTFGFKGAANDFSAVWDYSFIRIPIIGAPNIKMANDTAFDTVYTDQISNVIVAGSPVSTNYQAYYLNRDGFGYSILINASFLDTTQTGVDILPPFPNPVVKPGSDDSVTFRANVNWPAPGKAGTLEATIFNISGEKVNFVSSVWDYYYIGSGPQVSWGLDNQSGSKIAPGVYLAYLTCKFEDGTHIAHDKFKIAIIK